MQRFLNHEICVVVTKDELRDFLQDCEDAGIVWANGQLPLSFADNVIFLSKKITIVRESIFDYDMVYNKHGDSMGRDVVNYLDLIPLVREEPVCTKLLDLNNLYD